MILCGWNTFLTAGFSWNLPSIVDSRIIHENKVEKERVQKVTQEIFGNYPQPRLEFAQYKVGRRYNLTISYQYFLKRTKVSSGKQFKETYVIHHFNFV